MLLPKGIDRCILGGVCYNTESTWGGGGGGYQIHVKERELNS